MQFTGGSLRVLFSFSAGLLLFRMFRPSARPVRTFLVCDLSLVALLCVPRLGGEERLWLNGLYETVCIVLLFPLLVYWGSRGQVIGKKSNQICTFLGGVSYPLYGVHFPLCWFYYACVSKHML